MPKAWIANFGLKYPLTHNLRFLLDLLVKNGHETRDFESVAELSAFAIQFRYGDDHRAPVSVDRPGVLKSVRLLHEAVARIVG